MATHISLILQKAFLVFLMVVQTFCGGGWRTIKRFYLLLNGRQNVVCDGWRTIETITWNVRLWRYLYRQSEHKKGWWCLSWHLAFVERTWLYSRGSGSGQEGTPMISRRRAWVNYIRCGMLTAAWHNNGVYNPQWSAWIRVLGYSKGNEDTFLWTQVRFCSASFVFNCVVK